MNRFIEEHAWFAINAALVAGLIALAAVLQGGAGSAGVSGTSSTPEAAGHVILGAPSKTTIKSAPAPAAPRTKLAPAPRPRIQGGELEDDD